ncbi:MAG: class I SAM-dependent methyltransferase [Thermoleophilaceae bacterium]
MSRPLYTSFAWAYDLVVPAPGGPSPAEIARLLAGRRRVVDAGCGTGRHAAALAEAGFDVLGVDTSPELLDVARRRAPDVDFERGDIRIWTPDEPFDGALCRGVLNDFLDDVDRQDALDNLARMLRPAGLLVVDVRELERTRARYKREPVVTRSAEGVFFRSETQLVGDVMHIRESISSADGRADYDFRMRPWTMTEFDERARAAGFTRVERRLEGDRIVAAAIR